MKKNLFFSAMAAFMLLFTTSCTQDEIVSANGQQGGTASLAVNIPVNNPVTRAVPNIPAGYKLRCILQLVDGSNNPIEGQKYVQEVAAGSESTTFTFKTPSVAYKCLLWADYVKPTADQDLADADNIYTTADLKAIGYTANAGTEMFNSDAADAFYGASLEVSSNKTQAITLARPFTRIALKSTATEYADYDKITVKDLPAPTGFNVLTGQTAGYAGKGDIAKISSTELTIANGSWFSTYLFVGSNAGGNLGTGNDITFTLKKSSDNSTKELKFAGTDIPLTQNNTVTGDVTPGVDDNSKVEVTFPGEIIDPNKMQVGDYIYKDGTYGKTFVAAEEANPTIGIVFAVGAQGEGDNQDKVTDYDAKFSSQKIAGYAMALTCTEIKAPFAGTPTMPAEAQDATLTSYSGIKLTNAIFQYLTDNGATSELFNTAFHTTWKAANPTTGNNLSDWYIPSYQQLAIFTGYIFGTPTSPTEGDPTFPDIIVNETFKASVISANAGTFVGSSAKKNVISSSITTTSRIAAVQIENDTNITRAITPSNSANPSYIRPVLTIFETVE